MVDKYTFLNKLDVVDFGLGVPEMVDVIAGSIGKSEDFGDNPEGITECVNGMIVKSFSLISLKKKGVSEWADAFNWAVGLDYDAFKRVYYWAEGKSNTKKVVKVFCEYEVADVATRVLDKVHYQKTGKIRMITVSKRTKRVFAPHGWVPLDSSTYDL